MDSQCWVNSLAKGGGQKKRFQYCLNLFSSKKFCTSEQFRDIQEITLLIHYCMVMYWYRMTFAEYICHIGNAFEMHSIIKSGLIPGGKKALEGTDSQSSSQPWTRWILNKIGEKSNTIWINLITIQQCKACSEKGIAILPNSIACNYAFKHTTSVFLKKKWYAWKLVKNSTAKCTIHSGYLA